MRGLCVGELLLRERMSGLCVEGLVRGTFIYKSIQSLAHLVISR